jgi:hypothetical protein
VKEALYLIPVGGKKSAIKVNKTGGKPFLLLFAGRADHGPGRMPRLVPAAFLRIVCRHPAPLGVNGAAVAAFNWFSKCAWNMMATCVLINSLRKSRIGVWLFGSHRNNPFSCDKRLGLDVMPITCHNTSHWVV